MNELIDEQEGSHSVVFLFSVSDVVSENEEVCFLRRRAIFQVDLTSVMLCFDLVLDNCWISFVLPYGCVGYYLHIHSLSVIDKLVFYHTFSS